MVLGAIGCIGLGTLVAVFHTPLAYIEAVRTERFAPMRSGSPTLVAPRHLETFRIAGEKRIVPDAATKQAIGNARAQGSFKLCIDAAGGVETVTALGKGTGFPAYDQKLKSTMQSEWRYRPYLIEGKAVPVCTGVTFIYQGGD